MATYWKSQPKKHCDFCHCWIADNKASIDFHERGKRHQENVEKKLKELRKRGHEQYQMQKTLDQDLMKMEQEALKAFKKDLMNDPALAAEYKAKAQAASASAAAAAKQKEELMNAARKLHRQGLAATKSTAKPAAATTAAAAAAAPASATADQPSATAAAAADTAAAVDGTSAAGAQCIWLEGTSPEGHTYYWNTVTGESQWDKPEGYEATAESTMYKGQPSAEEGGTDQEQTSVQSLEDSSGPAAQGNEEEEQEEEEESAKGDEEEAEEAGEEEGEKDKQEAASDRKEAERPAKRKLTNPYGGWTTVVPDNTPPVDLQLPEPERPHFQPIVPQAALPQPRERVRFKEKTVSSLAAQSASSSSSSPNSSSSSGGQASFKKRKFGGGARSIRQRDADT